MARTITETMEEQNSIEVTRDSKGAYKYVIKVYFGQHPQDLTEAKDTVECTLIDLKRRFEGDTFKRPTNGRPVTC